MFINYIEVRKGFSKKSNERNIFNNNAVSVEVGSQAASTRADYYSLHMRVIDPRTEAPRGGVRPILAPPTRDIWCVSVPCWVGSRGMFLQQGL